MSPLPPVSHCSASAKTFIDTEKSHGFDHEKTNQKKAMMDSCHVPVL